MRCLLALAALCLGGQLGADEKKPAAETGAVAFTPLGDQSDIPERYRLAEHRFNFTIEKVSELPVNGVEVHHLRYPSPVASPFPENNTVHAEFYRPKGPGPFPAVIVLDITGGNQDLSRMLARHLAQNKIAGLFVQMAYYGPRQPADRRVKLLSSNVPQTMAAIRQTVLDLRCATAWLESRPELDKKRLGIMGTSLGSFMAALTGEMEPKLGRVAVLLGGGGFVDAYYDHPQALLLRTFWEMLGGTKEQVAALIAPVDPLTRADLLRDRKLLIVAAKFDEIVPPQMAVNLWNATGKQQIVWLPSGHFTAAFFLAPGLQNLVEHFGAEAAVTVPRADH